MRRRRQKFQPDALAFVGIVAQKNYPAFLFLVARGIRHLQLRPHLHRFVQIKKSTVGVHYNRLASLAKLIPVGIYSSDLHGDTRENPGTSSAIIGVG